MQFFLSYFKLVLLGFTFGLLQRQFEHKGTTIKHLCVNWDKKGSRCLSTMDFRRRSITTLRLQHDEQNISLSSTWKGYFLALSFVVKFGRRCNLVFSVEETYPQGMFVSYSTKEATFCRRSKQCLNHMLSIYTGNSDWPEQRKGLFALHQ